MIDLKKTLAKAVDFVDETKKAEKSTVLKVADVPKVEAIQIPDFSK